MNHTETRPTGIKYDRRDPTSERRAELRTPSAPLRPPTPAPVAPTQEVALRELGAAIAASVADVQRELARYPSALGAYVLDELEIALPVKARIDDLGQAMVTVVDPKSDAPPPAMVRFRLRPLVGALPPPLPAPEEPLSALGTLSADAIAKLQARRIYSVGELRQVTSTAAGAAAVARLQLGVPLTQVLDRARLLDLPGVPSEVGAALLKSGVESVAEFARADPHKLAVLLTRQLTHVVDVPITSEIVATWQHAARDVTSIPLPRPVRK